MNHLSQTEQAVQTSYMMTLGNWNDTGQYRRRCEKGEQRQRLEEHRASQSKKTLRLRQQGMKFLNLPNCLGNMEMNMWNLSLQNQPIAKPHLSCSVLREKMGKIMITDLPNELLLKVADDLSYIFLIKENWELWWLKISWLSNFLHWISKVFSWLNQPELGAVMLVCKRWTQV